MTPEEFAAQWIAPGDTYVRATSGADLAAALRLLASRWEHVGVIAPTALRVNAHALGDEQFARLAAVDELARGVVQETSWRPGGGGQQYHTGHDNVQIVAHMTPGNLAELVHKQSGGWGGYEGTCGAQCACGVTYDNFATLGEASALLDGHIATANAAIPAPPAAEEEPEPEPVPLAADDEARLILRDWAAYGPAFEVAKVDPLYRHVVLHVETAEGVDRFAEFLASAAKNVERLYGSRTYEVMGTHETLPGWAVFVQRHEPPTAVVARIPDERVEEIEDQVNKAFLEGQDDDYIRAVPVLGDPGSALTGSIHSFALSDGTRFRCDLKRKTPHCWVVTHRPCPACGFVVMLEQLGVRPYPIPTHTAPGGAAFCPGVNR